MTVAKRLLGAGLLLAGSTWPALAAAPSAADALKLQPVQKGVEIDQPTGADATACTIKAEKASGETAWVVRDSRGQVLRRFSDTNNDNVVDLWCYFNDGVEVYRDIDSNFNQKADQCRWLNIAGTRWGLDKNEDGVIDAWKAISPEEVSAEVVAAVAARDAQRFANLLLTEEELTNLGVGPQKAKQIGEKLAHAPQGFEALARDAKAIPANAKWLQFSGIKPGLVPAGIDGSTQDVVVYENAVAIVDGDQQPAQLQLGTLIRLGDTWRLIDAPQVAGDTIAPDGIFFFTRPADPQNPAAAQGAGGDAFQKLLAELDELDKQAEGTGESPEYHAKRADLLEKVAAAASDEDRAQWVRQMADTVSAAVQAGQFPEGAERLERLAQALRQDPKQGDLAAYVQFRTLTANYGKNLQNMGGNDWEKVQAAWLDSLKQFVADFPSSNDTPEALLQLGIAEEFAGNDDAAVSWYDKIVQGFGDAPAAKKAAGAKVRLTCVGKALPLRGQTVSGQAIDLSRLRGKIVLLHYWASTSDPSTADLAQLKELFAKFGKSGFSLVGVSLDQNDQDLAAYLNENPLPWPQIYEPGGLESRPATELGILTLPTMILIDEQGQVISRNIHVSELETELKKRLKVARTPLAPQAQGGRRR